MRKWQDTRRHWRRPRTNASRARSFTRVPMYARVAIPILLLLLIGRLAYQSVHSMRGASHAAPAPASDATIAAAAAAPAAPWQRDFFDSLEEAVADIAAGNITAAEVAVDRSESILTSARLSQFDAPPAFFSSSIAALDRVIQQRPQDDRLFDHVTQARASLAELRSSLVTPPGQVTSAVRIGAPREIAANETLVPRALGGNYLDASLMPDTAEILLPPTSRSFTDGIRVENIEIAGAAQTLDGIRWRDVAFIGTRLRYENGELDLQNVRFVRCRFGLPSDERGARLANAIALGQSSITIQ